MQENLQKYFESIQKRPSDTPTDIFKSVRIQMLEATIEQAEAVLAENPNEEIQQKLDAVKADLAKELKHMPVFVFIKSKTHEYTAIAIQRDKDYNSKLKELLKTDVDSTRERIYDGIETDALAATLSDGREEVDDPATDGSRMGQVADSHMGFEVKVKEILVTAIMQGEGMTEDMVGSIPENTAELKLTEEEEEEARAKENKTGIDAVKEQLDAEQRKDEIIDTKKSAITKRNLTELDRRREELNKMAVEQLVDRLVYLNLASIAMDYAQKRSLDWLLYYEVCDPAKPIKREKDVIGYERAFRGVDDLSTLREADDEMYSWMMMKHKDISEMPGVESLKMLADYEPFRALVESLPQ